MANDARGKNRGRSGDALGGSIREAKQPGKNRGFITAGIARTPNRKPQGAGTRENAKETSKARVAPQGAAWDQGKTLSRPNDGPKGKL